MHILVIIIAVLILVYILYEAITVRKFINDSKTAPQAVQLPFELQGYAPIYNLPTITVDLDPPNTTTSSTCSVPVRTDLPCASFCGNSDAVEMIIDEGTTAIGSTVLTPGRYCSISEPVPCSKNWGMLLWGDNGWQCLPKHPDIVGGPSANVPNFSFYNSDTLLGENTLEYDGNIVNFADSSSLDILLDQSRCKLNCNSTIDGFNMVQLGNSFKCVRDPCQTIPGTDSRWDGSKCVCGPNQTNIDGPLTPCVGSNFIKYGYDEVATTDYAKIECVTLSSPWLATVNQPCPSFGNQTSTYGYSAIGKVDGSLTRMNRSVRSSGFVTKQ